MAALLRSCDSRDIYIIIFKFNRRKGVKMSISKKKSWKFGFIFPFDESTWIVGRDCILLELLILFLELLGFACHV